MMIGTWWLWMSFRKPNCATLEFAGILDSPNYMSNEKNSVVYGL